MSVTKALRGVMRNENVTPHGPGGRYGSVTRPFRGVTFVTLGHVTVWRNRCAGKGWAK